MAHLITGNKFDPNKHIPDLTGRVYIVTGGTAGIGYGITAHLLQHNAAKIILVSQKEEHAEEARQGLQRYGDTTKVHWVQCDFKDLKNTNKVSQELHKTKKQIDAVRRCGFFCRGRCTNNKIQLICNAGEGVGKYNETIDGLGPLFQ